MKVIGAVLKHRLPPLQRHRAPRPWYLDERSWKGTRDFVRDLREVRAYWEGNEHALSLREGNPSGQQSRQIADHMTELRRDIRVLADKARRSSLIGADDEAELVGDDRDRAMAAMVRLHGGAELNEPRPVDLAGPPIADARREGGKTTVVFISWTGASTRDLARAADWAIALRSAGFAVIDHAASADYDWILGDIARSDAMVAIVGRGAETWASIEWTSASRGTDTHNGLRGSWEPVPVFAWFVEPVPMRSWLLDIADRLPDDFDAAVAHVIRALRQSGE